MIAALRAIDDFMFDRVFQPLVDHSRDGIGQVGVARVFATGSWMALATGLVIHGHYWAAAAAVAYYVPFYLYKNTGRLPRARDSNRRRMIRLVAWFGAFAWLLGAALDVSALLYLFWAVLFLAYLYADACDNRPLIEVFLTYLVDPYNR